MSLDADELRALHARQLQIDALQMELRRDGSETVMYQGAGEIRMRSDGSLEYVLFDRETTKGFGLDYLPPGTWVPPEQFLKLEVIDWRGRRWVANHTIPETCHKVGRPGVVCRGELQEITLISQSYRTSGEFISLFARFDGDIPLQAVMPAAVGKGGSKLYAFHDGVWEIAGPEYKLRMIRTEDGLQIDATREIGNFPEEFDARLIESMWFLLASPVDWSHRTCINSHAHSLTIRPRPEHSASPRLRPPLEFHRRPGAVEPCGRMLLKYLEYVGDYPGPRYHPTSINIRRALLASATSIETEALALGIAVESFIRREYKEFGTPDTQSLRALEGARDFWQNWSGSSDLRARIQSSIDTMRGTNPGNAMKKLVHSGVLHPEHRSVWTKLRNTTAHGLDLDADYRQIANWCDITYDTFLRLIFSRIGYEGPYTDRGTSGWPDTMYP